MARAVSSRHFELVIDIISNMLTCHYIIYRVRALDARVEPDTCVDAAHRCVGHLRSRVVQLCSDHSHCSD